jgi:hypothetical protein
MNLAQFDSSLRCASFELKTFRLDPIVFEKIAKNTNKHLFGS